MHKLRVGVLMGGISAEREVSFNSGRTVCDHLDSNRYIIVPLFQRSDGALFILPYKFLHRGKITDFLDRLELEAECISWDALRTCIDFLYLAVHGKYAEDGTLQGMLELLGVPYLGSRVYASAVCMDKSFTKKTLTPHAIRVPRDIFIAPHKAITTEQLATIIEQLNSAQLTYPVIVKPLAEGSSLGVSRVEHDDTLPAALMAAWHVNPDAPQPALIEEFIEGMEFSCILLRDYKNNCWLPLPPTEIVPEIEIGFFDYEQKYMPGKSHKFTPARCTPEALQKIQETCVRVSDILEMRTISRIDGFLTPAGEVIIVDPNTLSGMGPASFLFREAAVLNMSHTAVINHLIETELYQYDMHVDTADNNPTTDTEIMKKIRVAVLLGGDSNEREISLESGRNVVYKLSPQQYIAMPLFVTDTMELYEIDQELLVRNSTHEIQSLLAHARKRTWHELPDIVDFVFIALHGGKGENGAVQGAIEMLKLPYNGSGVAASALCMDKYKTNMLLASQGISVPRNMLIAHVDWQKKYTDIISTIINTIGFPCIIKPHDDGCSMLVSRAVTEQELAEAINIVFAADKQYAIIEELITGTELTIGVLGNEKTITVLPPSQAVAQNNILSLEEKFLPGSGQNITPAPLSPEAIKQVQEAAKQTYLIASCAGYARIDCFYQHAQESPTGMARVVILEINSLPALTPATCIFHQAAEIGISPMTFISRIIELGCEKHKISLQHRTSSHNAPIIHKNV